MQPHPCAILFLVIVGAGLRAHGLALRRPPRAAFMRRTTKSVQNSSHLTRDHRVLGEIGSEASLMVDSILSGTSVGKLNLTNHIAKMTFDQAIDSILKDGLNLPDEVVRILRQVKSAQKSGQSQPFSEDMLDRAREILNGMIQQAQVELDTETVKCKEFKNSNRKMHEQVMADLNRISAVIGNFARMTGGSQASIQETIASIQLVEEETQKINQAYDEVRMVDEAMMKSRKTDLEAATFIMKLTACPENAALLTFRGARGAGGLAQSTGVSAGLIACPSGPNGTMVATFRDPLLAAYARNLSRSGFAIMQAALLGSAVTSEARTPSGNSTNDTAATTQGLVSHEEADGDEGDSTKLGLFESELVFQRLGGDPEPVTPAPTTTMPPTSQPPAKVSSKPDNPAKQANKCALGKPNCGLLHDGMSIMWGEMKDAVDQLQAEMTRKEQEHEQTLENMNEQKKALAASLATHQEELSEATTNKGIEVAAQQEKSAEAADLQKEFDRVWGECKATISDILFTKICGSKKVRGTILKESTVLKPDDVVDCEVGDWLPGQCSVACDDKLVGGVTNLTREVIQKSNDKGVICPSLVLQMRCGQFPCPVHCKMSKWSSWSKCTKECEGGVQSRSRLVEVKPKSGGEPCESTQDSQPCNTGSCDRDCTLKKWTQWSSCSQACDGGFSEKFRRVDIPLRAHGQCQREDHKDRYRKKQCNEFSCVGDEVCVAKYDLILAIDGSGSLKEKGFNVLKDFAAALVRRFKGTTEEEVINDKSGKPYINEMKAMQVGVVQFGNGRILDDGTIQGADIISPLSTDMPAVESKVRGLTWQRGFTNMAQAFTASANVLMNGGRKNAQSVVMVITDGKPSFNFQTQQEVNKLRDEGVRVVMVPVKSFPGKMLKTMKAWASAPWQTNLVYIKGLRKLKANLEKYVNKALVQSCPRAESTSAIAAAKAAAEEQAELAGMAEEPMSK